MFNNYTSFVNPSLHLILCGDGGFVCKNKKNIVSSHAVADNQENYSNYRNRK